MCRWGGSTQPWMVPARGAPKRALFVGQAGRVGAREAVKRYSTNEAKASVRAIPVETARARLTGTY